MSSVVSSSTSSSVSLLNHLISHLQVHLLVSLLVVLFHLHQDPQVTSFISQNSLTLAQLSGQLSNISAQVGSLNNFFAVAKQISISDQLDRQREAAKQKREATCSRATIAERAKNRTLERKAQNALLITRTCRVAAALQEEF